MVPASTVDVAGVIESGEAGTVIGNHVYVTGGVYTVTITVTEKDGGVGMSTRTVDIPGPEQEPGPPAGVPPADPGQPASDPVVLEEQGTSTEPAASETQAPLNKPGQVETQDQLVEPMPAEGGEPPQG